MSADVFECDDGSLKSPEPVWMAAVCVCAGGIFGCVVRSDVVTDFPTCPSRRQRTGSERSIFRLAGESREK